MKYKVGDKVRIKSLDWYNENKNHCGEIPLFKSRGLFVPDMSRHCNNIMTIKDICYGTCYRMKEDFWNYNWTDEMIECKVEEETKPKGMGEVSDGYHTFNELYEYRMLYNAALFNEFAKQGLYDVHKSRKHSDGEYPFGDSNWFIVMAELPTGQISNHYEMKDWDKFQIPEKPLANKWDEHSPRDVAERLTSFTNPKKEYPKSYEECYKIMGIDTGFLLTSYDLDFWKGHLLTSLQKLLICHDAYWKIAGKEMGLGKPWEPDWEFDDTKYVLYFNKGEIVKDMMKHTSYVLAFPTAEMRDAFYENFKELIEECKKLL